MNMTEILATFASEPLFAASVKLLKHLGVKASTETEEPIPFLELYEESAKDAGAEVPKPILKLFNRVEKTYFIGAVDDETLAGKRDAVDFKAEPGQRTGMFIFAVQMKDGETLTRSEASILTRGINRVVRQQPATVLILEDTSLSVATCERTPYKQSWRPGEKLGKVSILKGVNCLSPHRGHIDILESMNVKDCKTFEALYAHWKDVFSAKLLTKQFYREIQNWYFWALKAEQHVTFPNALDDDADDDKFNKENLIRLITRLVFTWFMKAKGLVNEDLFKPAFLAQALKHFDPEGVVDYPAAKDADRHCTYYRAILQNLFFATFNQEIGDRGFVDKKVLDAKRYNIKNFYRNAQLFTETDEAKIIAYFNGSPFVNGGLFECLDNVEQIDKETGKARLYSWDGFSNSVRFKDGSLKSALIPDRLFFGAERTVDLSEFLEKDKSAKAVKVRGIVNILNDYVFTIEENTPLDEDVALDPELLGKVFENLLGCYNPETQQMARNATGSFYTPREIVNYMVHVSLAAYLKRTCPKIDAKEIDQLVEGTGELDTMPSVKAGALDILKALFKAKILDPACGSGAFPMGTLSAMVEILRTVDPDNKHWFKIVLEESLKEAECVADVGNAKERAELKTQIEYDFQKRVDFPDYARKLYVIEHCIFGSDIQPIAVQISRLRFFITLLCEQAKTDDPDKNYGITPLPNLENNFVAANSLLSIDLKDMREVLQPRKVGDARTSEGKKEKQYESRKSELIGKINQLRAIRHQLFLPKSSDKKKTLKLKDEKLRCEIEGLTVALYDTRMKDQLAFLEKQLQDARQTLANGSDAELNGRKSTIQDAWFGVATKTTSTRSLRERLQANITATETRIAEIKNDSSKKRLLNDVARLISWNPFAFNVAESFLDPEWMFGAKNGFNIVIGNPPYGLINKRQNKGLGIVVDEAVYESYKSNPFYQSAQCRGINIYRLFVLRSMQLLENNGVFSEIFPLAYAGDLSAAPLRNFVFSNYKTLLFDAFPERDDERKRVFEAVKMSVGILTMENSRSPSAFNLNIRTDKDLTVPFSSVVLTPKMLKTIDPENMTIPLVSQEEMDTLADMCKSAIPLGTFARCATGELDMTFAKSFFTRDATKPTMHRGAGIGRYLIHEHMSQGEKLYVDEERLLSVKPKLIDRKRRERVVLQGITGVNEKIRLKAMVVSGAYCANSVNYIENNGERCLNKYLLGLMNSRILNFYFTKFSTNSNVNGYEVDNLPIVIATKDEQIKVCERVDEILAAKKQDPDADTSALESQIDSIVYKLYGLTDDEIKVVEKAVKK